MKTSFIILVWIGFAIGNIALAEWNNTARLHRIATNNPKQIEHFWYGLGYGILCGGIFYISRNYWELFSLLLLHISVFPIAFNLFCELPAFHLSKTSAAKTDQIMVKMGLKSTEWVNLSAFLISIAFVVLQILKLWA